MDLDAFQRSVLPAGLNLLAVAAVSDWDAVALPSRRSSALQPGARSILVVANGGGALWTALLAELAARPTSLTEEPHPLDAFVRRTIATADPALGAGPRRWFWASAEADLHIDFRLLAGLAGLGAQSRLGLLLHPAYGPWIGLRAACFLEAAADDTTTFGAYARRPGAPAAEEPSALAAPCRACPAPCARACPGEAFPDGRWNVDRCVDFHRESPRCASTCEARLACPEGAAHRYSATQLRYHSNRLEGRRELRALLGPDAPRDRLEGDGPHWGSWRDKVDARGVDRDRPQGRTAPSPMVDEDDLAE